MCDSNVALFDSQVITNAVNRNWHKSPHSSTSWGFSGEYMMHTQYHKYTWVRGSTTWAEIYRGHPKILEQTSETWVKELDYIYIFNPLLSGSNDIDVEKSSLYPHIK